jgi:hypothetical protein
MALEDMFKGGNLVTGLAIGVGTALLAGGNYMRIFNVAVA